MRKVMIAFALTISACSSDEIDNEALVTTYEADSGNVASAVPVSKEDETECDRAKKAAVVARGKYDRDYEQRNPGSVSMRLSADELTTCKLSSNGAFLGKWGGQRWRFVPKTGSKYVQDPKRVWVGENEGLDDLSWFSEWRSDGASVEKNEELNRDLKAARNIYG